MRLLIDQNLSHRLVPALAAEYPASEHVRNTCPADADDETIWTYARDHDYVIVSKDIDFSHRCRLRGHPPKVVWLRIGNGPTADAEELLRSHQEEILAFAADPSKSLLTLPAPA